ncbi:MAG: 30S ribosomal protein S7, partial [Planctomycetota bacterium]|nr:30S ribosomal protein S7 [Planctomycetota bacterium]
MAGRITKSEQQLEPDPKYGDKVLAGFINSLMIGGNKATTTRIVYKAFEEIERRIAKEPLEGDIKTGIEVFHQALDRVRPSVEVRSKRVGGANY